MFVSVPTYREAENIEELLRRLRAAVPDAHILVIDDGSPDGTAELAEKLAVELGGIEVLRRPGKSGLGAAYRAGHAIGLARGYDVMVQIDADLSHQPEALPSLLEAVDDGADLAIGSRYVEGGAIPQWPVYRLALSRWGCRYAAWALRTGVADSTAGYRAYRASALEEDALRDDARQRLHVPDRDDLPARAGRRPRHRGADHVHRPRARHVEDVGPDRRRGDGPRHAVGPARSSPAPAQQPFVTATATPDPTVRVDRVGGRDRRLDGLRALAAIAVILTHVGDWTDSVTGPHASWIQELNVGVDVFFVISAVLLYAPFVARHLDGRPHPGLGTYTIRRFLRIYPRVLGRAAS